MHVLFVSGWVPGAAGGARTRTYHLMKQASKYCQVSVLSFAQPDEEVLVPDLRQYCQHVEVVPLNRFVRPDKWSNRAKGWFRLLTDPRPDLARTYPVRRLCSPLERLIRQLDVDLVQVESLIMAELLPNTCGRPALLNPQNVEAVIAARARDVATNPIHRVRDHLAWRKLRSFERRWVMRFPACLAVSDVDSQLLQEIAPHGQIHVVPNGVDTGFFEPPAGITSVKRSGILFAGNMDYRPNVDGAVFFCREIWPLVRQVLPQATLTILGAKQAPEVLSLRDMPGVDVVNFVEDPRPYFWQAAVSVVPLRVGGGTRFKILESLAAGCPVVTTTVGVEGLDLQPGLDYLLADAPRAFAESTIRLINDKPLSERLASHGQQTVRGRYDWQVFGAELGRIYRNLIEAPDVARR
jgi:polysaccharide biosynthesis protein PslH